MKLAAVKDALDRAGLGAKTEVALKLKPYEHILADVAGVANISREESRARRGLPDDTTPAEPAYEIVDAELVDDGPAYPPDATAPTRTPTDHSDLPDHTSASSTGPPSRELQTLDEAAADASRGNRSATRIGRTRRVR